MKSFSGPLLISLRILALALAALVLFSLTVLLCWTVIAQLSATSGAVVLGVLCGLIVWLFVAVFHFRREKIVLPFATRGDFLSHLKAEMTDLGYDDAGEESGCFIFRPKFLAMLFGGTVRAELGDGLVAITGPKVSLENIHRRLRLHLHVDNARSRKKGSDSSITSVSAAGTGAA